MGIPIEAVLETDVFFEDFAIYRAFEVCRAFTVVCSHATEIHVEPEDEAPRLEIHTAKRAADKPFKSLS